VPTRTILHFSLEQPVMKTRSLRHLLETRSDFARPSRRYRVQFTLFSAAFFLLGNLYTYLGNPFNGAFASSSTIKIEVGPKLDSHNPAEVSYLWSYVTGIDTPGEHQTWDWVSEQRREGYRRPSWGALRSQGAKAHMRDNLYPDKKYLNSYPVAG
jgi:hypothetical protein